MQNQYINEMLDIPELEIRQILPMSAEELHIEVTPVAEKQCCPICRSDEFVILKGSNGMRKVRHLPAFEKKSIFALVYHSNALLQIRGWFCLGLLVRWTRKTV
jgi:hypothetical protein